MEEICLLMREESVGSILYENCFLVAEDMGKREDNLINGDCLKQGEEYKIIKELIFYNNQVII